MLSVLHALASAAEVRGKDAMGIVYFANDRLCIYKRPQPAHNICRGNGVGIAQLSNLRVHIVFLIHIIQQWKPESAEQSCIFGGQYYTTFFPYVQSPFVNYR